MSASTWQGRVAWTLALLLVLPAFVWLGMWQWRSATLDSAASAPTGISALEHVVPLESYVPRAAIGSRVRATGVLRADLGVLVCGRDLGGRSPDTASCWLVEPLVLGSGAAVAVVTGVVAADAPRDLTGEPDLITVTAILQPSEGDSDEVTRASTGLPLLPQLTTRALLEVWPYQLHDGYLVSPPVVPLMATPPAGTLILRNAAYAVQWWLFAGFAVFVWWRAMRPVDLAKDIDAGADTGTRLTSGHDSDHDTDEATPDVTPDTVRP